MKPPSHPADPLLQAITDEAADLPGLAAAEVRRHRTRRRQQRRRLAGALLAVWLGVCLWQSLRTTTPAGKHTVSTPSLVAGTTGPAAEPPAGFVKVQTVAQAQSDPVPVPSGVTQEQRALLEACPGLPVLLVMDDSGRVARIHVVER